jgi:chaperonin GroES
LAVVRGECQLASRYTEFSQGTGRSLAVGRGQRRRRSGHTTRHLESTYMKVRPLHDRIIVQRLEEGEQKVGGIIIPDTAKEKPQQGKVIAAGAGKVNDEGKRQPLDVKEGDTILFGKYSGQEIKIDGEEYLIMREDEVLAVLESK